MKKKEKNNTNLNWRYKFWPQTPQELKNSSKAIFWQKKFPMYFNKSFYKCVHFRRSKLLINILVAVRAYFHHTAQNPFLGDLSIFLHVVHVWDIVQSLSELQATPSHSHVTRPGWGWGPGSATVMLVVMVSRSKMGRKVMLPQRRRWNLACGKNTCINRL